MSDNLPLAPNTIVKNALIIRFHFHTFFGNHNNELQKSITIGSLLFHAQSVERRIDSAYIKLSSRHLEFAVRGLNAVGITVAKKLNLRSPVSVVL